jgi:hypothetical protein
VSDQRRFKWRSGRLASTPINDGWALTLTLRDPAVPNLPLEYAPRFRLALSANIAASAATSTTNQLSGSASFTAGKISDDTNPITVDVGNNGETELEWCIQATADAEASAQYEFRVVADGVALDTYTVTPKWTVSAGASFASGAAIAAGVAAGQAAAALTASSAAIAAATGAARFVANPVAGAVAQAIAYGVAAGSGSSVIGAAAQGNAYGFGAAVGATLALVAAAAQGIGAGSGAFVAALTIGGTAQGAGVGQGAAGAAQTISGAAQAAGLGTGTGGGGLTIERLAQAVAVSLARWDATTAGVVEARAAIAAAVGMARAVGRNFYHVAAIADKNIVARNCRFFFGKFSIVYQHVKFTVNWHVVRWVERINKLHMVVVIAVS